MYSVSGSINKYSGRNKFGTILLESSLARYIKELK